MGKKLFNRCDRVSVEIKRIVSDLIKKRVKDPRLKDVTITEVRVSRDLRIAKIYFTIHKNSSYEIDETMHGFISAKGYIKRGIAHQMNLRYTPEIVFFYDKSFDYGAYMNKVFKSIKKFSKQNNDITNQ